MAKSKRKTPTAKSAGVTTKKKRDDTSCAQSGPSFNDLCDNTLLRILSYSDDLRSLISLTRCTSKSLRRRFDLNTPEFEYFEQYKKFWQGVFADLQMTPLEESDGKSHDYIGAINYRLSLFSNLIGYEKRKKAGTNRSYSLPLRQYNYKRLNRPWKHRTLLSGSQFKFISNGSGQEYVIVNPDTGGVEVYDSIMERVQCLDKSIQKKREAATTSTSLDTEPSQQILSSYLYSIKEEARLLNRDWEEYFGNDAPFEPYVELPPEDDRKK